MAKNPLNKGTLTSNAAGIGPVTRAMVDARTRELALIAGRKPPQVTREDHERARRELTGGSDTDRQEAVLDALPESKRWDPVPGSAGTQARESPSEDEDEEGRSETEQLVDDGVIEAERNQMLRAAQAAAKKDRTEP